MAISRRARTGSSRFVFEADRRRFILRRGALRAILAAYNKCVPDEIRFTYSEHGKPKLAVPDRHNGLEFNTSASQDLAAIAVTCGSAIGVDIEFVGSRGNDEIVERFFSPSERDAYLHLPTQERPMAFYRAWTRKEAYLKATGAGLSRPLSSFTVLSEPGRPPRLIVDEAQRAADDVDRWTFVDFEPSPGYVGSLVTTGKSQPVCYRAYLLS